MADNSGSRDRYLEALDFIIKFLKDHEQNLDKSIDELATVTEQMEDVELLDEKVESFEEKISTLQKKVTNLVSYLSNVSPTEMPSLIEKKQLHTQTVPAVSPPEAVQSGPFIILRCKEWSDFQGLAKQAQMLTFSLKEDEKVFQVDALKENKIITYKVALPDFSIILKKMLSGMLDIKEQNIIEGSLDKPK